MKEKGGKETEIREREREKGKKKRNKRMKDEKASVRMSGRLEHLIIKRLEILNDPWLLHIRCSCAKCLCRRSDEDLSREAQSSHLRRSPTMSIKKFERVIQGPEERSNIIECK
jgi:hypothetical protein